MGDVNVCSLPNNIWLQILRHLSPLDLARVEYTSTFFRRLACTCYGFRVDFTQLSTRASRQTENVSFNGQLCPIYRIRILIAVITKHAAYNDVTEIKFSSGRHVALFVPVELIEFVVKSCPNLKRLSFTSIKAHDAFFDSVSDIFFESAALRTLARLGSTTHLAVDSFLAVHVRHRHRLLAPIFKSYYKLAETQTFAHSLPTWAFDLPNLQQLSIRGGDYLRHGTLDRACPQLRHLSYLRVKNTAMLAELCNRCPNIMHLSFTSLQWLHLECVFVLKNVRSFAYGVRFLDSASVSKVNWFLNNISTRWPNLESLKIVLSDTALLYPGEPLNFVALSALRNLKLLHFKDCNYKHCPRKDSIFAVLLANPDLNTLMLDCADDGSDDASFQITPEDISRIFDLLPTLNKLQLSLRTFSTGCFAQCHTLRVLYLNLFESLVLCAVLVDIHGFPCNMTDLTLTLTPAFGRYTIPKQVLQQCLLGSHAHLCRILQLTLINCSLEPQESTSDDDWITKFRAKDIRLRLVD